LGASPVYLNVYLIILDCIIISSTLALANNIFRLPVYNFAAIFLATYSIGNLPILKASDVMFIDSDNSPAIKSYCVLYCYSESST